MTSETTTRTSEPVKLSDEIGASTQTLDPQTREDSIYYERLEKAIRTTIAGLEGLRIADAIAVLNHAEATISKWTLVPDFSRTPFSLTLPPHP